MTIRENLERIESEKLSSFACLSSKTQGRRTPMVKCDIRTEFQRDRDRILHSRSFRRLKDKTQVFPFPVGDHYRTRLTHTLEVSQIARTISKSLGLNEDLTEAISLGHDLGHTAFGHAGESALNDVVPGGFRHNEQSLRVVDILEREGEGLNLTFEVRNGILKHTKGRDRIIAKDYLPSTLEGNVVRIADIIAYVNHDIEDAIRAGMITHKDLPQEHIKMVGDSHGLRIDCMVRDVIMNSLDRPEIKMSQDILVAIEGLRDYLYNEVYTRDKIMNELGKATKALKELYQCFVDNAHLMPQVLVSISGKEGNQRAACDFIAGMSDKMALNTYQKLFLPQPWSE